MPITVQCHGRRGVPKLGLDRLDAGALGDEQARASMAEVMEPQPVGTDALGLASQQEVGPNLQDVRKLRIELEPWRDSGPVRTLDERLALAG